MPSAVACPPLIKLDQREYKFVDNLIGLIPQVLRACMPTVFAWWQVFVRVCVRACAGHPTCTERTASQGPPSLLRCTKLEVRKKVTFAAGVVFEGEVVIVGGEREPIEVCDGLTGRLAALLPGCLDFLADGLSCCVYVATWQIGPWDRCHAGGVLVGSPLRPACHSACHSACRWLLAARCLPLSARYSLSLLVPHPLSTARASQVGPGVYADTTIGVD